jgi:hypothetical protein
LHKNFLEWFVGFTDEGNFNISLRNFSPKTFTSPAKYNSFILTFQIGLHIDDVDILNYLKKT